MDAFCEANGGMVMFTKDGEDDSEKRPTDPEDAKHPYNRAERWVSACDTVAQLYVDVRYDPAKELAGDRFTFSFPVGSERNEPYNVGVRTLQRLRSGEEDRRGAREAFPRRGR